MGEVQTYYALPCWEMILLMGGVFFQDVQVAQKECEECEPHLVGSCIGVPGRVCAPVEVRTEEEEMSGKCPLVPQDDKLVFVKVRLSEKTEGGVIVPSKVVEDQLVGRVVAVGPWCKRVRSDQEVLRVEVGDLVLCGKGIETTFFHNTTQYYVCGAPNVLCKLVGVEALELDEVEA